MSEFLFLHLLLHLFDIMHDKWICAGDFIVLGNVGHHLAAWSLYKITLEFYDGKC